MRILILSQVFWPDTASTSQHLSDLAFKLSELHKVSVITSRHDYENPKVKFHIFEVKDNVSITRLNNTSLGKRSLIGRSLDFFSFNLLLTIRLFGLRRNPVDLILGMTSPPLVSFIGSYFAKRKQIPFVYWTMDLQPELAIASGLLRKRSVTARMFLALGNYVFRNASRIIVLDKYMQSYVVNRGANSDKVSIVPVWPVMDAVYKGGRNGNPFRNRHNFGNRIVIMYSGNHSFIHPLDTLLDTALKLKDHSEFLFVFVGGGVRKSDVTNFRLKHKLSSILQLEYQPRDKIHISLGAADIQVVIMGNGQIGFTHPNKVYGAMFIGKPILYIGPKESHVADVIENEPDNIAVRHGESQKLADLLIEFSKKTSEERERIGKHNRQIANRQFHPEDLKQRMVDLINDI